MNFMFRTYYNTYKNTSFAYKSYIMPVSIKRLAAWKTLGPKLAGLSSNLLKAESL